MTLSRMFVFAAAGIMPLRALRCRYAIYCYAAAVMMAYVTPSHYVDEMSLMRHARHCRVYAGLFLLFTRTISPDMMPHYARHVDAAMLMAALFTMFNDDCHVV